MDSLAFSLRFGFYSALPAAFLTLLSATLRESWPQARFHAADCIALDVAIALPIVFVAAFGDGQTSPYAARTVSQAALNKYQKKRDIFI